MTDERWQDPAAEPAADGATPAAIAAQRRRLALRTVGATLAVFAVLGLLGLLVPALQGRAPSVSDLVVTGAFPGLCALGAAILLRLGRPR